MRHTALVFALVFASCVSACRTSENPTDTGPEAECAWYPDVDGDGWGAVVEPTTGPCAGVDAGWVQDTGDCEDADAALHPEAAETCDGRDQDCDGVVDDDATDALTWFPDADADGFGDPAGATDACAAPDGYLADDSDCDDDAATVHPGAAERCNSVDDDCDGDIDEDIQQTWYADVDADGFGNAEAALGSCDPGEGWVADPTDCDDQDPAVHPGSTETCDGDDQDCDGEVDEGLGQIWYADADGDGWGDADRSLEACDPGPGWVEGAGDCDDANSGVHPDATERCDGYDDDCDGLTDEDDPDVIDAGTWYTDVDADGYGADIGATVACLQPAGTAAYDGDCDDADPAFNPGATEDDCADPNDYNCDGSTGWADADADGWAACEECDDGDPAIFPGAVEICNGLDDDCSGEVDEPYAVDADTWYADFDADGYGDASDSVTSCIAPSGYIADAGDCDDSARGVHPGAIEVCDGVDQDCDGGVDEGVTSTFWADGDGDGFGDPAADTTACTAPAGYVADATDCDDADATSFPGAAEVCDGADQDCDGVADDGVTSTFWADGDGDGFGDPADDTTACAAPAGYVAEADDGVAFDCDDGDGGVYPGADEYCDGTDEDCDGAVDDGAVDALTWYDDLDGDGYGDPGVVTVDCTAPSATVAIAGDCDDADGGVHPAAAEHCDGVDEDCDGIADDTPVDTGTWYTDADADGYGDPSAAIEACSAPSGTVADARDCDDGAALVNPGVTEICDGVDDDCDGLTDDADPTLSGASTWYLDHDADGYGTSATPVTRCTAPTGYIATAGDCDDGTAAVHPGATEFCDGVDDDCDGLTDDDDPGVTGTATWYADADGDGYGAAAAPLDACAAPSGHTADGTDCDDGDSAAHPGAAEVCGGGDEDCDGLANDDDPDALGTTTWYFDYDGDGWGDARVWTTACVRPSGYGPNTGDCDDLEADTFPGNPEVCDGMDNDCDSDVDEDDPSLTDALTWYADADGDGYGDPTTTTEACTEPTGYVEDDSDCDDADAFSYPSGAELWDRADNDCDGDVDEDLWTGDGSEGDLTVWGTVDLSTLRSGSRLWADAERVLVTAIDGDTLTVAHNPWGLASGDEVLLINLQGSRAAHAAVGTWEFASLLSVTGTEVELAASVAGIYGETDNSDLTDQVIVLQRVPHYEDVTVFSGGLLTIDDWDGGGGGVLAFRASGTVTVEAGGTIDVSALGYEGGGTGTSNNRDAFQGESYTGLGIGDVYGGPYNETIGGYLANGGGGGANVTGGGGNHAAGASSGDSWNYGRYTAPACGGSYSTPSLETLFFGSGGGGVWNGGHDDPTEDPGPGGNGAGILHIGCDTLVAEGADTLLAVGETTPYWARGTWTYGAGGGAGGSVFLVADEVDLASGAVNAEGGLGESTHLRRGGDGGYGRVRIDCNTCDGYPQGSSGASTALDDASEPDPGYSASPH